MAAELQIDFDRIEALELLAVVQATLNAVARSRELTVGAAILTGIRSKLIGTEKCSKISSCTLRPATARNVNDATSEL